MELFSLPPLPAELMRLRGAAQGGLDPAASDEVLALLLAAARLRGAERILEIGTAEGLTSVALLCERPHAELVTVENDPARYTRAVHNFVRFGVAGRTEAVLADAAALLPRLQGPFDLVFLDGPKAQYVRYLPHLKRLLAPRGLLFADDVLLYGWVDGRAEPPPKRRSIAARLGEYLAAVTADPCFATSILRVGEGVALSVLRGE